MKTIIYLIRNAKELTRDAINEYNVKEAKYITHEKQVLSSSGEAKAKELASNEELEYVNVIYSSHFVSSISTAKYLAENLNIPINVDERLGERKLMNVEKNDMKMFLYSQENDFDYKMNGSESINEVKKRFTNAFDAILFTHAGKEVAIFTHEKAIIAFLLNFCTPEYNLDDELILTFNDLNIDTRLESPDCFKLIFESKELVSIERIS